MPCVLVAEGRPCTFGDNVLARDDIVPVLLRFEQEPLPEHYLRRTRDRPSFTVSATAPLTEEAARYREWATGLPRQPEYFCNPDEPLQEVAQRFAGLVGLPHLSEQQVLWVRDKTRMKDRFGELGIGCAAYRLVRTKREVAEFGQDHGWPVVIKPTDSFACLGTYRVNSPVELADVPVPDDSRQWMVEEFVNGTEYQLCALVAEGRVLDAYLSGNPAPILRTLEGAINANITYAANEPTPVDPIAVAQQLADGIGFPCGYLHGEFFLEADGTFRMGELAGRISGCEVPMNHGLARGFDMHRAIMDTYVGRVPELRYTCERSVGDLLLPVRAGTVVGVSDEHELAELPGVIDVRIKVKPGQVLNPPRASFASSGYVHVAGTTADEVTERMHHVLDHYLIEIE
jgi:biotin carboxylase